MDLKIDPEFEELNSSTFRWGVVEYWAKFTHRWM